MLIGARGKPQMVVSDNGTEFTSNAMLGWAKDHGVDWHYIAPGRPMQNGYIKSFNGRMRDELLNESLFIDLDQARRLIGAWVTDYNTRSPALLARLQNAGRLCRYTHRAEGRNLGRGSKRRWMKVQWQVTRDQISGRQIIPAWVKQLQSIDGVHNDSHEDIYREMIDGTSARAKELISEFNNRFVTTSEAENAALRAMIGVQAVIKWANEFIGGGPIHRHIGAGQKKVGLVLPARLLSRELKS